MSTKNPVIPDAGDYTAMASLAGGVLITVAGEYGGEGEAVEISGASGKILLFVDDNDPDDVGWAWIEDVHQDDPRPPLSGPIDSAADLDDVRRRVGL